MRYIYHYHAMQPKTDGSIDHYGGCLTRDTQITSAEGYRTAIAVIAKTHRTKPDQMIVCALSLLNPSQP